LPTFSSFFCTYSPSHTCTLPSFPTRRSSDLESPGVARRRRVFGFVFQDSTLLPWRSTLQNVLLPLEIGGSARRGRAEALELLEVDREITRLNSSQQIISYAVFFFQKKNV